jgi:hypothetical protein
VLTPDRLQVRWRDWLADGADTGQMSEAERLALFTRYATDGRDRMNGRAAGMLAPGIADKPLAELADQPCREALLRCRQVHVGAGGWIMPGVCAGIIIGQADEEMSVGDCWRSLEVDHASRPVVGALASGGPGELLTVAMEAGFAPAERYAGKCHLCWSIRQHLHGQGLFPQELGPSALYDAAVPNGA